MKSPCVTILTLLAASSVSAQTTTYGYDALGRLTSSQRSDGVTTQYSLDGAGNRTRVVTTGGGSVTVADASFEEPAIGSGNYVYAPSAPGVRFVNGAGISANSGAWGFTSPDGQQVAYLQYGPSQIIMNYSGATPGASYRVRFLAAVRPGYTHSFTVVSAGQTLATITPGAGFQSYTSGVFTASQSSGTIEFDCGDPGYDGASGIDLVQIVPA